jgi:hypothetical protein
MQGVLAMFRKASVLTTGKRALFCIAVSCLMLALSASGFGQKQVHSGKINVPFDFFVGGTKFPAGQYTLEGVLPSHALLRSQDGKKQQALYFNSTPEAVKNFRAVFAVRYKVHWFVGIFAWYGKMQYTGFNPHAEDEMKDIPITPLD